MNQHSSPDHDPRTCRLCGPLRHPSHVKTRRALAALPRQAAHAPKGGAR
ncbi:hypothetical protein ACPCSP_20285 [Streptomyces cinereoruber]